MKMKGKYKMSVGVSSMLMIFIVLALTTFAVLSFVTANLDYKWTSKAVDNTKSYYAADVQVQEIRRNLDEQLLAAGAEKAQAAKDALANVQDAAVTQDGNQLHISFSIPMADHVKMSVVLTAPLSGGNAVVAEQKLVDITEFEEEIFDLAGG